MRIPIFHILLLDCIKEIFDSLKNILLFDVRVAKSFLCLCGMQIKCSYSRRNMNYSAVVSKVGKQLFCKLYYSSGVCCKCLLCKAYLWNLLQSILWVKKSSIVDDNVELYFFLLDSQDELFDTFRVANF